MNRPAWILDTREQDGAAGWGDFLTGPVVRAALPTGDLSILGYEDRWSIERKTKSDFLGCLGAGRERFLDGDDSQVARLSRLEFGAIIIEADLGEVLAGSRYSKIHRNAISGSVAKILAHYRVPVVFGGAPAHAADLAQRLLVRLYNASVGGAQ